VATKEASQRGYAVLKTLIRGRCQVCDAEVKGFYCETHHAKENRPPKSEWMHVPPDLPPASSTEPVEISAPIEKAPESPYDSTTPTPPGPRRRFWQRRTKGEPAPGPKPPKAPKARKPPRTTRGPRRSTAEYGAIVWNLAGQFVGANGHVAAGRTLSWQSKGAGELLDDAVKGTFIDKVAFQPLLQGGEKFGALGALALLPIEMDLVERSYVRYHQLVAERASVELIQAEGQRLRVAANMARLTIGALIVPLSEAKSRAETREAAERAAVAKAFPDLAEGVSPVDALFASILGISFEEVIAEEGIQDGANADRVVA
jgi:hypothetical protein